MSKQPVVEKSELELFLERKTQLKQGRTNWNVEKIWQQADADYLPHELGSPKKKHLVEDIRTEVSSFVSLEKDDWRSKLASNDPYIKIQTAISILFDKNPEGVFSPAAKRFEPVTALIGELYHRTWSDVNLGSKKELRKFLFNFSKYGWAPARRYYKKEVRKGMNTIKSFNIQTNEFEYEKKDIVDVDDVFFESLNPFDVWIDDMALPDSPRSRRDWMWRCTYDKITATNLFGDKVKDVDFSGKTEENQSNNTTISKKENSSKDLATFYYYENRLTDKFIVEVDDKIIVSSPLMREDKELSLVDTYWTLRSTECPFGIGINEIMRNDKVMYDRIKNMTIDQVVLSIYKMFFYSNSETLDDEGGETINVSPGKGKKVIDPKNISWMEVPGPGQDSYRMADSLKLDMENDTGINRTLGGEITGKTAFEVGQAKEGALKRLSVPLRNIKSALEWDAKLCIGLQKMIYSVPKVFSMVEPELITNYIASIEDDQERYFVDPATGVFNVLKYREFQLNLEQKDGKFVQSQDKAFFMVKPSHLDWDGQVEIRVESMVEQSKSLERNDTLQMANIVVPLLGQMATVPPMLNAYIKTVKEVLREFDKDPIKWLPKEWLGEIAPPAPINLPPPTLATDPNQPPAQDSSATTRAAAPSIQSTTTPLASTPQTVVPNAAIPPIKNFNDRVQQVTH